MDMMQEINKIINSAAFKIADDDTDRAELIQQGWVFALELLEKGDPDRAEHETLAWLHTSIVGRLSNYKFRSIDALDYIHPREEELDEVADPDTPEHAYMRMQKEVQLDWDLMKLVEQLSPKQTAVCANMFADNPLNQRELAAQMGISQPAVAKLTRKVFKKAKAIGEYNNAKL